MQPKLCHSSTPDEIQEKMERNNYPEKEANDKCNKYDHDYDSNGSDYEDKIMNLNKEEKNELDGYSKPKDKQKKK